MREDAFEYIKADKIEKLLVKYSEFIEFPINIFKEKTEYESVPDVEANKDLKEDEEVKMKIVPNKTERVQDCDSSETDMGQTPKVSN